MDRRDYYFLQLLSESELDDGFEQAEQADRAITVDAGLVGVHQGLTVSQRSGTPDLNVQVAAGAAYDQAGQRMQVPSTQVVDMSTDNLSVSTDVSSGGNEKIVSLFLAFERSLSDPRIDGNSAQVFFQRNESFSFFVKQGSEGAAPATPPALEGDKVLLADVRRSFGQTQIFDADITPPGGSYTAIANRRQAAFDLSAGSIEVKAGTSEESDQQILTELNNHITGVSNLHPASAIDYAGGSNWADGTTNPATTVEGQLDKIVDDLRSVTGAAKIGAGIAATWADASGIAAATVDLALEEIVNDLASTSGANKIGAAIAATWADASGVVGGTVDAALEEIVGDLAGNGGTAKVGGAAYTGTGTSLSAGTLQAQLRELADELAGLAAANNFTAINTFAQDVQLSGTDSKLEFSSTIGSTNENIVGMAATASGTPRNLVLEGSRSPGSAQGGHIIARPGPALNQGSLDGEYRLVFDSNAIDGEVGEFRWYYELSREQPSSGGAGFQFLQILNADLPDNCTGYVEVDWFAWMGDNGSGSPGDSDYAFERRIVAFGKKGGVLSAVGAQEQLVTRKETTGNPPTGVSLSVPGSSITGTQTNQDQAINSENNFVVQVGVRLAYAKFALTDFDVT